MKPIEKAEELTEKFMVRIIFNHKIPIQESSIPSAKECALACVDEIIQSHLMSITCEDIVVEYLERS